MRQLFYAMVEMITEKITGIENGAMTLWELPTYLEVSREVIMVSNVVCALMIPVIIVGVVTLFEFFHKLIEKFGQSKKQELV